MLLSGTFTMAVMYFVLLCDSIVAGYYIGEAGVAAINAITPLTGVTMFFGDIVSIGASTIYAREVGAMRKRRADEIFGQGLIVSLAVGLLLAAAFQLIRDVYFSMNGTTGEILEHSLEYYRFLPLNAFLTVFVYFLEQMVYSDGDELCNNICYAFQIGGNIVFSVILTKRLGMTGNILGSVIGNGLGILVCGWHFFRKGNTLHFVWHLSFRDFLLTSRYSIVDASLYLCWGLMDYVMIGFVSRRYGTPGLVALAMVISLLEFSAIMDGVGLAMQPLISTYFGEKNHRLIKRVIRAGIKAALIEGAVATALIFAFARQFCALFGVTGGASFAPSIAAVRIVSLGLTFCSAVSLTTSYYADRSHRDRDRLHLPPVRLAQCAPADVGLIALGHPRRVGRHCHSARADADLYAVVCAFAIWKGELPLPALGYGFGDRGHGRCALGRFARSPGRARQKLHALPSICEYSSRQRGSRYRGASIVYDQKERKYKKGGSDRAFALLRGRFSSDH